MSRPPYRRAGLVLALLSALALGFALLSQHSWGLVPCQLCLWQRWPHRIVIALGLLAAVLPRLGARASLALAVLVLLAGAGIGLFHVGVEAHWWAGLPSCAVGDSDGLSTDDLLAKIESTPSSGCDQVQWSLAGISMAGWNALLCLAMSVLTIRLLWRTRKA